MNILFLLLFGALVTKQRFFTNANVCPLNTECKNLRDCPGALNNFHLLKHKPYCNLNESDTFVCCLNAPEKYTQDKDEDVRSVRECKSYHRYRPSCTKPLIVGGNMTEPKEFPFMGLLFYKIDDQIKPVCSGTLISNKYVLTVAHCFYQTNQPTMVRLGELDWSITTDDAKPVDYKIQNIIIHPQYFTTDIQEKYNDIALVELAKEVEFNDYILPACLPLVHGREFKEYLAAGWGYQNDIGINPTTHMFKVKLDRFDDDTCINKVKQTDELSSGINLRTQMCAGSFNGKRDKCSVESGGPLFVDHPDFRCLFLVSGITSFGNDGCDNTGTVTVYTRIQGYLDWIEQVVWKEAAKLP